jgi:drug/metabolite transporter (DMT)-like permease
MSIFIVVFMYAIWSTVFSLGKMALEVSPPLFLTASRFLIAGVLFLIYLILRNRAAFKISLKQFLLIGALGISGTYLTNAFEFWMYKLGNVRPFAWYCAGIGILVWLTFRG